MTTETPADAGAAGRDGGAGMTGSNSTRTSGERARSLVLAAGFQVGEVYRRDRDGTDCVGFHHPDGRGINIHYRPSGHRFARAQGFGIGWARVGCTARTLPELVRLLGPASVGLLGLIQFQFGDRAAQLGYSCTEDHYPGDFVLWDVRDRDGQLIWDSNDPDVKPWPFLGQVVDLLAPLIRLRSERGDGLLFDLDAHTREGS